MKTTFDNGSLGSRNDEERSELRYVMWIAEFSESSNLWTHIALSGIPESMLVWEPFWPQNALLFGLATCGFWAFFEACFGFEPSLFRLTPFKSVALKVALTFRLFMACEAAFWRCWWIEVVNSFWRVDRDDFSVFAHQFRLLGALLLPFWLDWFYRRAVWSRCPKARESSLFLSFSFMVSNQARRPAELKHINKRRKRNQQGFP